MRAVQSNLKREITFEYTKLFTFLSYAITGCLFKKWSNTNTVSKVHFSKAHKA